MDEPQPKLDTAGSDRFAGYPRASTVPEQVPGSPDQLLALSKGFVWLMWVWPLTLVAMFDVFGLPGDMRGFAISPVILGPVITVLAYPGCRKIASGMGWSPILGVLCALVIGGTFIFCIGIFVAAALLQRTATLISRYGVPRNAFGAFRRADVIDTARHLSQRGSESQEDGEAIVSQMRTGQSAPPPPAPPPETYPS